MKILNMIIDSRFEPHMLKNQIINAEICEMNIDFESTQFS